MFQTIQEANDKLRARASKGETKQASADSRALPVARGLGLLLGGDGVDAIALRHSAIGGEAARANASRGTAPKARLLGARRRRRGRRRLARGPRIAAPVVSRPALTFAALFRSHLVMEAGAVKAVAFLNRQRAALVVLHVAGCDDLRVGVGFFVREAALVLQSPVCGRERGRVPRGGAAS